MRKIIYILLALGVLVGCRSKKVTSEARKVTSEAVGVRVTDSTTEEQQRGEVHTFDLRQAHSYELTLEGDSLEVKSEKQIVKNDKGEQAYIEVLKVKGGKAVIKMKQEARQEAHAAESLEAHQHMKPKESGKRLRPYREKNSGWGGAWCGG